MNSAFAKGLQKAARSSVVVIRSIGLLYSGQVGLGKAAANGKAQSLDLPEQSVPFAAPSNPENP
jgi:hypothetical protein